MSNSKIHPSHSEGKGNSKGFFKALIPSREKPLLGITTSTDPAPPLESTQVNFFNDINEEQQQQPKQHSKSGGFLFFPMSMFPYFSKSTATTHTASNVSNVKKEKPSGAFASSAPSLVISSMQPKIMAGSNSVEDLKKEYHGETNTMDGEAKLVSKPSSAPSSPRYSGDSSATFSPCLSSNSESSTSSSLLSSSVSCSSSPTPAITTTTTTFTITSLPSLQPTPQKSQSHSRIHSRPREFEENIQIPPPPEKLHSLVSKVLKVNAYCLLHEILINGVKSAKLFEEFCQKSFCDELVHCYRAIVAFKDIHKTPDSNLKKAASNLFNNHIKRGAIQEVNISQEELVGSITNEIMQSKCHRHMFNQVLTELKHLLVPQLLSLRISNPLVLLEAVELDGLHLSF